MAELIDKQEALTSRCYIRFDTNEQLLKFVKDNTLHVPLPIKDNDVVLAVFLDGYLITNTKFGNTRRLPEYHHTQLK